LRTGSPRSAGHPRLSMDAIAIVVVSCMKTIARTVSSPFLVWAFRGVPTPPDTGRRGSGVMILIAAPASNDWLVLLKKAKRRQAKILYFLILILFCWCSQSSLTSVQFFINLHFYIVDFCFREKHFKRIEFS